MVPDSKTCPYFTEIKTLNEIAFHVRAPCFQERCELWVRFQYSAYFLEFIQGNEDPISESGTIEISGCCAKRFKAIREALGIAYRGVLLDEQ